MTQAGMTQMQFSAPDFPDAGGRPIEYLGKPRINKHEARVFRRHKDNRIMVAATDLVIETTRSDSIKSPCRRLHSHLVHTKAWSHQVVTSKQVMFADRTMPGRMLLLAIDRVKPRDVAAMAKAIDADPEYLQAAINEVLRLVSDLGLTKAPPLLGPKPTRPRREVAAESDTVDRSERALFHATYVPGLQCRLRCSVDPADGAIIVAVRRKLNLALGLRENGRSDDVAFKIGVVRSVRGRHSLDGPVRRVQCVLARDVINRAKMLGRPWADDAERRLEMLAKIETERRVDRPTQGPALTSVGEQVLGPLTEFHDALTAYDDEARDACEKAAAEHEADPSSWVELAAVNAGLRVTKLQAPAKPAYDPAACYTITT